MTHQPTDTGAPGDTRPTALDVAMPTLLPGPLPDAKQASMVAQWWHGYKSPNPFEAPTPPVAHQPGTYFGDYTVKWRTPDQIREIKHRRVNRWLDKRFKAVPRDATREDMIASVFGAHGWATEARIVDVSDRWPMHGWLLTHQAPGYGYIVYADKPRDGDLGPDYIATRSGPWGSAKLVWGEDLTSLVEGIGYARVSYPHVRTAQKLIAHAYRSATPDTQTTANVLLALTGYDLPALLATADADDLSILPA